MLRIVLSGPRASEQLIRTSLTGKGLVLDPHCDGWVAPEGYTGKGPDPRHDWHLGEAGERCDDESWLTVDTAEETCHRVQGIVEPYHWEVRSQWEPNPPPKRQPTISEAVRAEIARMREAGEL